MERSPIEWHFFDADTEAEWSQSTVQLAALDASSHSKEIVRNAPKMRYVYELICAIALLCGVAVYLLWQHAAQRITMIEREVAALRNADLALQDAISEADELTTGRPTVLSAELLEKAVVNSRAIRPQWQGMVLALKTYVELENGHNHNWQWEDLFLLQRYNAQSRSLDFVLDLNHESVEKVSEQLPHASPTAYVTANPLVEFILVTYGVDTMPKLLDAFEEHDSWETLTSALFHLSADEFEAQWHAYLRKHYPIPR